MAHEACKIQAIKRIGDVGRGEEGRVKEEEDILCRS